MLGNRIVFGLLAIPAFTTLPSGAFAQAQLTNLREINLPVPSFRGIWWGVGQSRWFFSVQLTPDHDLLVYEPNSNGKWPLIRVRKWWTKDPVSETLSVPGWSAKDGKDLESLNTDLLITPDGRYALTFAAAQWRGSQPGAALGAPASGGSARRPDALINVVDLSRWEIVGGLHTAAIGLGSASGERILNPNVLVLKGLDWDMAKATYHYKVISVPALDPGPGCTTELPRVSAKELKRTEQERLKRDETVCTDVLKASGLGSMGDLEAFIQTGRGRAPAALSDLSRLGNSLLQSPSGDWYGLDSNHSALTNFDARGEPQKKGDSSHLLCANQPVQGPAWDCSCGIVGLSEGRPVLLAACLTQRDGLFTGRVWLRQWLAVFHADDLSEIGSVRLANKDAETKEAIATVDGHTYVLAVILGKVLTVYAVPGS